MPRRTRSFWLWEGLWRNQHSEALHGMIELGSNLTWSITAIEKRESFFDELQRRCAVFLEGTRSVRLHTHL